MTKKVLFFILNSILLTLLFYTLSFVSNPYISPILSVILLITGNILYILSIIFKWFNLKILSRLFYVIFIIFSIVILLYTLLYKLNFLDMFSSVTSLKNYILSTEEKGVFVYIIIQAMQVVFLPIPAAIICIVGSIIYGPLLSAIYCSVGILLGSYISFLLGKTFGYKLVSWIVGKDNTDKYSLILRKRGGFFLSLAFLLPMFPDDILCLIAGITNMKFKTFFLVTLITRPIGVIFMAYFGSGNIIPFTGWGIYVWIGLLIVATILVVCTYRYQEKMQEYILNSVFKRRKSKNNKTN